MAHASAVILTSSKVESYLEDLISDWGTAIAGAGLTAATLPPEMRAFLMHGTATKSAYRKLLLQEHGERDFLRLTAAQLSFNGEYRFAVSSTLIIAGNLHSIVRDVKYPSEPNLKKLFARCGIRDIFTTLNSLSGRDVLALHTSFSDLRTEIAHSGLPAGINGKDVRDRIKEMRSLIGYIDRAFYRHVSAFTGPLVWIT
jgi:hypothetical protein